MSTPDDIINRIYKDYKSKIGLFCLNCLIMRTSFEELNEFVKKNNIAINETTKTKTGYIKEIVVHFHNVFKNVKSIRDKYSSPIDLMGDLLLKDDNIKNHLTEFDYIAKQELVNIFADYCADFKISVFNTSKIPEYSLDLYLTKKTPRLRTESVIVRTSAEMDLDNYENTLELIQKSSEIAMWSVFVTTPAGVYKIGFDRIVSDMENFKVWFYVVDPRHKKIYGITKGKKSKNYDQSLSENYLQKLPREPVRAPSQVIKFSKYEFKENESYNPKRFHMYEIFSEEEVGEGLKIPGEKHKYRDIFRNLIIIDKTSGISIFSYENEIKSLDYDLISGFLVAMDQFVSELGGGDNMREINYKGFFIQAGYGEKIKVALFLSKSADKILKERLAYFINEFEKKHKEQIKFFQETGNVSYFKEASVEEMAKEILDF
ncbi:MAG: hypothetical protein EU529_03840 [Promethearchaeota archaeon]|nr:MAG: hypothetical protein EU529_03840 [Candidatus Lokiarchaeota archaeon]